MPCQVLDRYRHSTELGFLIEALIPLIHVQIESWAILSSYEKARISAVIKVSEDRLI